MTMQCPFCAEHNPQHANFCSRCGRAFALTTCCGARRPGCSGKSSRVLGALVLAGVLAGSVAWVFDSASASSVYSNAWKLRADTVRDYDLRRDKADAVYEILAPRDVKVLVSKRSGGLRVRASSSAAFVLDEFISLVSRLDHLPRVEMEHRMRHARDGWCTSRTYKLGRKQSTLLQHVLAFDNVPVLVSRKGSRLRVEASPQDQETVASIVRLLHDR